jgi:hypothetical protein
LGLVLAAGRNRAGEESPVSVRFADFYSWVPLACRTVTSWLEQHNLPTDPERLADALYGQPCPFDGVAYASLELVLGAAPIRAVGKALFEIDEDAGRWAVLQPVAAADNAIEDVIAWHPDEPASWRTMRGDGEALGLREVELRQDRDGPLVCYATPASWLRGEGRGICFLTRDWAAVQRILIGERELAAETVELGKRLDRILRYRPAPRIYVTASPMDHAA